MTPSPATGTGTKHGFWVNLLRSIFEDPQADFRRQQLSQQEAHWNQQAQQRQAEMANLLAHRQAMEENSSLARETATKAQDLTERNVLNKGITEGSLLYDPARPLEVGKADLDRSVTPLMAVPEQGDPRQIIANLLGKGSGQIAPPGSANPEQATASPTPLKIQSAPSQLTIPTQFDPRSQSFAGIMARPASPEEHAKAANTASNVGKQEIDLSSLGIPGLGKISVSGQDVLGHLKNLKELAPGANNGIDATRQAAYKAIDTIAKNDKDRDQLRNAADVAFALGKPEAVNSLLSGAIGRGDNQDFRTSDALMGFQTALAAGMAAARESAKPAADIDDARNSAQYFIDSGGKNLPGLNTRDPKMMREVNHQIRLIGEARGLTPADIATRQTQFNANAKALTKLEGLHTMVGQFEKAAGKNLDVFLEQAQKLKDHGSPALNKMFRGFQRQFTGNDELAAFDTARITAFNEVSKVLSGGYGAGVVSDSARNEANELIKGDYTLSNLIKAIGILRRDMANRMSGFDDQAEDVSKALRQGGLMKSGGASPAAPTSSKATHRFNPATGKIEAIQ